MVKKRELTPEERVIVYNRRKSGEKLKDIGNSFEITAEGVRDIVSRLGKRGEAENLPRSGWPRKTSATDDWKLLIEVKKIQKLLRSNFKKILN